MTEEEVEGWRRRLNRIWSPQEATLQVTREACGSVLDFEYWGRIQEEVAVLASPDRTNGGLFVQLEVGALLLLAEPACGVLDDPTEYPVLYRTVAREWLPFFRRGCWLCGYNVQATAHEKAEWMRGFTKEELEAWNLKM